MFEDSRLTNQLRKADYQREFYSLIKALEESIDPAPDADSLEDLNYDPDNGGIKDGTVKYVIGYGLFRLDVTSTLPVDNVNVLGTGYAEGRWLILEGGGTPVVPGMVSEETVTIAFDTPSPVILTNLFVGDLISEVRISVRTPFDSPGATVQMGTAAEPSLFFGPADTDLTFEVDFESNPLFVPTVPEQLRILLDPSGASAGNLLVYYRIRRAP
jgi:hypothetical protein